MSNYLVVGASSGIGLAIAEQLVHEGHRVYATYNKNHTDSFSNQISYHPVNVLDEELNLDFLSTTLDGVVYCPGSISLRPFNRIKPDDFAKDYQLQVIGAIKIIQACLPNLKQSSHAGIVLFSTLAVQTGLSYHTQVAASKGAIEGLTRALAAELAPQIRVHCIAPSLTDTPLAASLLNTDQKREANAQRHPLKRIGTPEDIANMACFLLSEKAAWMTGQIMHLDGGLSSIKL
jgi:NAD(P)-dependent dehydrogenase (short-subunit alcohol dehydrogenase family)